ncbi:MAG: PepSY domain-containing protein [Gammaproteobacteria bacterium]
MSETRPPRRARLRRSLLKIHKWAGLGAGLWLLVLGATGIVLDHDEWRWARQITVPQNWVSPTVARLLPATRMRYVAMDPNNTQRWIGGSERGFWWTDNGGVQWWPIEFVGLEAEVPQVTSLVNLGDSLDGVFVATDDGIWLTTANGRRATRAFLGGVFVNQMSLGSQPDELVGIVGHDRVFRLPVRDPQHIAYQHFHSVKVSGLPEQVSLYRFAFDLHFGYGIGNRTVSTLLNDYAGMAFIVLAISGFLFWWFPLRWRRATQAIDAEYKKGVFNWIYRCHAPIVGLLALLPIGYIALTAIPMSHTGGFGNWAKDVMLPRQALTPVYQYRSLRGELDHVVAYPEDDQRLSVGTRFGVLHTFDGGRTWTAETAVPRARGNLFRIGQATIFSDIGSHFVRPADDADWRPIEGLLTGITHGVQHGEHWVLKNSRGFHVGKFEQGFEASDIAVMPDLPGSTLYLFLIEIHVGLIVHRQFKWVNDLVSVLALLLVITGPVLWWRTKWR